MRKSDKKIVYKSRGKKNEGEEVQRKEELRRGNKKTEEKTGKRMIIRWTFRSKKRRKARWFERKN